MRHIMSLFIEFQCGEEVCQQECGRARESPGLQCTGRKALLHSVCRDGSSGRMAELQRAEQKKDTDQASLNPYIVLQRNFVATAQGRRVWAPYAQSTYPM